MNQRGWVISNIQICISRDTPISPFPDQIPKRSQIGLRGAAAYSPGDEVFFSGTASEITPIREIDGRKIGNGKPGQITRELQKIYLDLVHGEVQGYDEWFSYIPKKLQKRSLQAVEI